MADQSPNIRLANEIIDKATTARRMVATAESCTGGLVVASLTEIAGSSAVVDRGFVTYSNRAKQDMLGVAAELIERHGAVSAEVAVAMAEGALARSNADMAVAITGIAGPGGGTPDKPVGLVHFALASHTTPATLHYAGLYEGMMRSEVREAAVEQALTMLLKALAR